MDLFSRLLKERVMFVGDVRPPPFFSVRLLDPRASQG